MSLDSEHEVNDDVASTQFRGRLFNCPNVFLWRNVSSHRRVHEDVYQRTR